MFNIGDRVKTRYGEGVIASWWGGGGKKLPVTFPYRVAVAGHEYTMGDSDLSLVAPNKKENKEVNMTQFKVGDRVRATGHGNLHGTGWGGVIRKGEKYEVVAVNSPGITRIRIPSFADSWGVDNECIEAIGVSEIAAPKKETITLDPYQFARFHGICEGWKPVFEQKTWLGAWKQGMEKHGGAKEMCEWLKGKGGNCVCGKGFAQWKKETERVLGVKLVDHRSFIERVFKRKK